MKTKIRLVLCGLAIFVSANMGWHTPAADYFSSPVNEDDNKGTATDGESLTLPSDKEVIPGTTGHVLLLENGRTLQGDIGLEGSQYRVRRSIGETWVPCDKVSRLCASLEEAYDFLRKQANLRDPDERMRLTRWCLQHDLRSQAIQEVSAAVELRPNNAEYRRLLQSLQRAIEDGGSKIEDRKTGKDDLVDPRSSILDPHSSRPVDLTAGSVSQFITKVQPVLMNTCAGCHGTSHSGPFQLERVLDNGVVSRRATQYNLAHVLAQINCENVVASPLLTRAVTIHGEAAQPPIKNRDAAAFHRLEDWVKQTLENNPQLRETSGGVFPAAEPRKEPKKTEDTAEQSPLTIHHSLLTPGSDFATSQPAPPKPTTPVDPFDPIIFNRQAHPEKQ
jgi:hypothetical protein